MGRLASIPVRVGGRRCCRWVVTFTFVARTMGDKPNDLDGTGGNAFVAWGAAVGITKAPYHSIWLKCTYTTSLHIESNHVAVTHLLSLPIRPTSRNVGDVHVPHCRIRPFDHWG